MSAAQDRGWAKRELARVEAETKKPVSSLLPATKRCPECWGENGEHLSRCSRFYDRPTTAGEAFAADGEGMPTEREWLEGLPEDRTPACVCP